MFLFRGVAQLGLAHLNGVQEVAGSNPVAPTIPITEVMKNNLVFYAPLFSRLLCKLKPASVISTKFLKLLV